MKRVRKIYTIKYHANNPIFLAETGSLHIYTPNTAITFISLLIYVYIFFFHLVNPLVKLLIHLRIKKKIQIDVSFDLF